MKTINCANADETGIHFDSHLNADEVFSMAELGCHHITIQGPNLKALLDNQLVSVTSEGTRRIYTVNPHGFKKIGFWLDQFWA